MFKTLITVYSKWYKKMKIKKISVVFCIFFLPWLFTALQVEIQFALGKGLR